MLILSERNNNGAVFAADFVSEKLFNFYYLKRRDYKDGTASWNLCCEPASRRGGNAYMVLGNIRGTENDAKTALERLVTAGSVTA